MSEKIPPGARCTTDGCNRKAVNPDRPAGLCPKHHPERGGDNRHADGTPRTEVVEGEVNQQSVGDTADMLVNDEGSKTYPTKDDSPGLDTNFDRELPGSTATDESHRYPPTLVERDYWVAWILDGDERKRPVAPWQTGHAYPVEWRADPDDDRPEVDFATARRWTEFPPSDLGLSLPDDARSDTLRLGVILPADRPPRDSRVVLIDWDDVRDPATGEIHPVAREYIDDYGGYVEVSRSGEGLHQYVLGGLRKRGKFIAPIDDEPFVPGSDDRPQVEVYDGGRHVAMTGDVLEGYNDDLVEGQDCINDIVRRFAAAERDAGHRTYDPTDTDTGERIAAADTVTSGDGTDTEGAVPDPEPTNYDGPALSELRAEAEASDRSLRYHAVVRAFCDGYAGVLNWRLEGAAAAIGAAEGRSIEDIDRDLARSDREAESFGYDRKTSGRIEYDHARAERGEFAPPSRKTLVSWGVLPPTVSDTDPVAVLPPAVRDLSAATSGWDWKHAGRHAVTEADPMQAARERTTTEIADALDSLDHALVEALPTLGKSYGAVKAVAETGKSATVLTGRGNVEQYDQFKQWCDEFDLNVYTLPAFTRDCPTAKGEHGEDWKERVRDWYDRGATPQEIHAHAEYHLGQPLPCQAHDDQECPYSSAWRFDPDNYDILLGHYTHAYNQSEKVTVGRAVLIDEFPGDAFERTLGGRILKSAVTHYLRSSKDIPFEDYTNLIEHRDDKERRAEALATLTADDLDHDGQAVMEDTGAHADAPLAVFTILGGAAGDLENGLERVPFPGDDERVGVFDRAGVFAFEEEAADVRVLDPPSLNYAQAVVALDGTPTKEMWELSLGERLNHRQVLSEPERRDYLREGLNLNVVQTTEYVKPYNSSGHVNTDGDAALLEAIQDKHGEAPGLITTTTALEEYDAADVLELERNGGRFTGEVRDGPAERVKWRGDILGSNEFKDKRLGVVIGSNHYGDGFVKKWGAYAGESVDRNDGKGEDLSYGPFGNKILRHMQEHDTLQALMRFGRDGNGAVVYVHTNTLPEWVPLVGGGRVLTTRSDGERQVLEAIKKREEWTTAEITDHPDVDIGERQVLNVLQDLTENGYLTAETEGRGYVWHADGLHRINEYGEVELESVDINSLSDDVVDEIARSSTYTWNFAKYVKRAGSRCTDTMDGDGSTPVRASIRGDPPPDDTE